MPQEEPDWLNHRPLPGIDPSEPGLLRAGWITVCPAGRYLALETAGDIYRFDTARPEQGWTLMACPDDSVIWAGAVTRSGAIWAGTRRRLLLLTPDGGLIRALTIRDLQMVWGDDDWVVTLAEDTAAEQSHLHYLGCRNGR